ncbi:MAG: type II toxin-antitoxin system RelE/ParE family toxin, partial [Sphingobacteriales bacterium]|nr:type II toxin-antitoxin system RelE/ParE family toxin [Sphingobacteriales bacterium]
DRLVEKIIERVDQLQNFNKSGRVVPEFNSEAIRELIEGNYRIVYKISLNQITIIRIHHAARQLK